VRVQKIVVNDLKDDTFYALIWVEREGQMMTIDSRPSDGPGPGAAHGLPIFVMNQSSRTPKYRAHSPSAIPTSNCAPGSMAFPTRTSAATRCN